jgi:hypothetical protein
MVDINNETTVATPAVDIERVLILQHRQNYLDGWENYRRKQLNSQLTGKEAADVISRVETLFYQIEPFLGRSLKTEEMEEMLEMLSADRPEASLAIFRRINRELDKVGLTKVDRPALGGNIIKRNKAAGLL